MDRDGSPGHIHTINYFTKYRDKIFQYAIFQSDARPISIKELTILHLHSYHNMRGYIKGIGAMPAKARMAASAAGYIEGIGAMSTKARSEAFTEGYTKGIGAMSAEQ